MDKFEINVIEINYLYSFLSIVHRHSIGNQLELRQIAIHHYKVQVSRKALDKTHRK